MPERRPASPNKRANTPGETTAAYLDYNASSPLDDRVGEEMRKVGYGNASSTHRVGRRQAAAVDEAREHVAALVGAKAGRVVFVSGATEANNLALRGLCNTATHRTRLAVSAVEHISVAAVAEHLRTSGRVGTTTLPATRGGAVDVAAAEELIDETVLAATVVAANSDTGVINDIGRLAQLAHGTGALLHCDATQVAGRVRFDMDTLGADLLSLSAHKMCGPVGVGALIGTRHALARITPILFGGPQERALRPGTENVAGIVGFGAAARIALDELATESARVGALRDRLVAGLHAALEGVTQNGDPHRRLPNTANVRFAGADADAVMCRMDHIAVSAGSACNAGAPGPSPTLLAMGLSRLAASESLRFSLGRFTTIEHVAAAVDATTTAVQQVRASATAAA